MSKLQAFLNRNIIEEKTEEVFVSDRFRDEETGELLKFKIRAVSMSEYKQFQKTCTKNVKNVLDFDGIGFSEKIVIAGTVDPSFKDAESIRVAGCTLPDQYLYKVLLPGEVMLLAKKVLELSGFSDNMDELIDEAKK